MSARQNPITLATAADAEDISQSSLDDRLATESDRRERDESKALARFLRVLRAEEAEERRRLTLQQPLRSTILEPMALAGRPLSPLGKLRTPADNEGSVNGVWFPALAWRLLLPVSGHVPAPVPPDVVDLYLWLIARWSEMRNEARKQAGYVDFTMGAALRELGWCPRDSDGLAKPRAAGRPTGRAYGKLRDGLDYMMGLRISAERVSIPRADGTAGAELDDFVIVQRIQLGGRRPGAGRLRADAPEAPSSIQFSSGMVELLETAQVALDADVLMAIPSGLPRALYRVLCWARHERRLGPGGTLELAVAELVQRLGYLRARETHARVREMLGPTHETLLSQGVLTRPPEHTTGLDGRPVVRYMVADSSRALSKHGVLVAVAVSYEVHPNVARGLAERLPAQFERVLVAITIGAIVPYTTAARAITHYTTQQLPITDDGHRWDGPQPRAHTSDSAAYLAWAAARRANLVRKRAECARWRPHEIPEDLTPVEKAIKNRETREAIESGWFTEGRAQLWLHHDLRIWSIAEWSRRGKPSG